MKVLIQNPETFRFLRVDSGWTPDVAEGTDFHFSWLAGRYGLNQLKRPFLILFKFERPEMDVTLKTYAHLGNAGQ